MNIFKICILITFLFSQYCNSAVLFQEGDIVQLKVTDPSMHGADSTYVEISGADTLGACIKGNINLRVVLKDDASKQYSLLLAAAMSSRQVIVSVDDTKKNLQGYCYLRNVELVI